MNFRHSLTIAAAAALVCGPIHAEAPVQLPELSLDQATLLRCSAVFAIVASEQERRVPRALAYPALQQRGKEYFVQASAQLMDELPASQETISALLRREVGHLQAESGKAENPDAALDAVMQPCLMSLGASGL